MSPPRLKLIQLPVPQPAALSTTGNVPLAAGSLAVATRTHDLQERLQVEIVQPRHADRWGDSCLADWVAQGEPEFLGLSLYLWNVERSLHLAAEVKRRSPRTKVIIGGPEVNADNPFVLKHDCFDLAVSGEAEDLFAALMHELLAGRLPAEMPGVAIRTQGNLTSFGPAPTANFPLTTYPSPYLEGLLAIEPEASAYIETVRGCRSHCTFCFYPRSSPSLRMLDPEHTRRLLTHLKDHGAQEVVFLDPTFNHRPDFLEILKTLSEVNHDHQLSFFAEIRAEGFTEEHARRMAEAGFHKVEIGLQSVNLNTLKITRRGGSPKVVANAARMLKRHNVRMLVDLIIGLPGDTKEDVAEGVDFLMNHDLAEAAQVFPLSMLPGTAMRASATQNGLLYDELPPYRIRRTPLMSESEMLEALLDAEDCLQRRLDEFPRPHLVNPAQDLRPPDVFQINLDDSKEKWRHAIRQPGAQHVALWFQAKDLYARRGRISEVLDRRFDLDPFAIVDLVLAPSRPFPMNLLEFLTGKIRSAPQSYASRWLSHRRENAQHRVCVVLERGKKFEKDYLDHLMQYVPVFQRTTWHQAFAKAALLNESVPGALVDGPLPNMTSLEFQEFRNLVDPEAVIFADREFEAAWIREAVGYREKSE